MSTIRLETIRHRIGGAENPGASTRTAPVYDPSTGHVQRNVLLAEPADVDAAYAALLDGRLAGVGLDVFDPEPPADHPLFHHPDVVLTPHVMALSRGARALVFEEMAAGMDDVLSGRRAPFIANPDVYEPARTP